MGDPFTPSSEKQKSAAGAEKWHIYFWVDRVCIFPPVWVESEPFGRLPAHSSKQEKRSSRNTPDETENDDENETKKKEERATTNTRQTQKLEKSVTKDAETQKKVPVSNVL